MSKSDTFKLQRYFDLLGNPLRFQIFQTILKQGCGYDIETQSGKTGNCVSGIMTNLNLPQSTVSTHIKELVDGGLIDCNKKGKYLYCRPNKQSLEIMKRFVDQSLAVIVDGVEKVTRRSHVPSIKRRNA